MREALITLAVFAGVNLIWWAFSLPQVITE